MKDVRLLTMEALESITVEAWRKSTEHVIAIENKLCAAERIMDLIPPVIISFSSDDDSDGCESSDNDPFPLNKEETS